METCLVGERASNEELTRSKLALCAEQLEHNWNDKSGILRDGSNAEDCSDCDRAREHKKPEDNSDPEYKPDSIDRCFRMAVDPLNPSASRQCTIA